jgi:predicted HicB family RNase H-like nuclease
MRQKEADSFMRELPNLMSGMFDYLEAKVEGQEREFKDEISEIVRRQQVAIKKDI